MARGVVWALAGAAVLLALYLLSGILLPFIVGMAAAYVLDPLADWLQRRGFRRGRATLLLTALFFASWRCSSSGPPAGSDRAGDRARRQAAGLFRRAARPGAAAGRAAREPELVVDGSVEGLASRFAQQALSYVGTALSNVVQSSLVVLNLVSLVFITPIVTFYLLRDWDRMVAAVRGLVPPRHHRRGPPARPRGRRGAGRIPARPGHGLPVPRLFYGLGLMLVGLDYGAIIGLLTGLFSFIPYVGMLVGVAVGLTVAVAPVRRRRPGGHGRGRVRRWASSSRATSSPHGWSAAASACTRSG